MNVSRNILTILTILSMVLLIAVPQASSSSIWRETETGPDKLANQYSIRSASSNAGATSAARSSFERSSDNLADDKVRRQAKAGKKSKLSVLVEAKPSLTNSCGPTPPSPLSCSGPTVYDGTATLTDVCPDCADETMTASQFEKLRIAPTPTCSALGYKALLGTSISIPSVKCLSSYLQEAAAAKTADSGTSKDDFDQVMIDFCVHQCRQEYWDGLASELKKTTNDDVNAFILETCKPSFPLEGGENSCDGEKACMDSLYTAIGDDSCDGEGACQLSEYATIGKNACVGYAPCFQLSNSNVGDYSCVSTTTDAGETACFGATYATIGTNSCLGDKSCSCIGNDGYGCSGIADKPVSIGNGSCTKQNSCQGISVDVGEGSCTYADSCSCAAITNDFSDGGVPDNTCMTAGDCC
jgi:hypothetical protein